jgi:dTDP-4-dehydrorhamnose reductase
LNAAVVGAEGQLGQALVRLLGDRVAWAGGREALDVRDASAVSALVSTLRPDVVFNAAAYNKVDAAETERELAFAVNATGPANLASACAAAGALLVHVSTDYVFDGTSSRPYREDDATGPLGAYGASKLEGESRVLASGVPCIVARTSGVLGAGGSRGKGGSFVERILARARSGEPLRVVDDQVFAPTFASDLAAGLVALLSAGARGLVHVTNAGSCSWHELAVESVRLAGLSVPVEAISTASLGLAARRPAFSVLDGSRYRSLGLPPLPRWRESLASLVASLPSSLTRTRRL